MVKQGPLDTTIEVVTPENISFRYQLAGPYRRLPAYVADFFLRWVIFILVLVALGIAGLFTFSFGGTVLSSFAASLVLVFYFVLSWFYGIFFETYFNGRTPGKWLCGIRVISDDGHPISGKQALLRNLIRVADLAPIASMAPLSSDDFWYSSLPISTGMVGLATILCTKKLQRLGDLAAGTIVVVDERNWTIPVAKVDDARVPALASFVPADYRVTPSMAKALASYAERRAFLPPGRRREISKHIAIPLIERFEFRRDIDPDLLLYALYYRTFLADSQAEPVQLGALAGFSPLLKDAEVTS